MDTSRHSSHQHNWCLLLLLSFFSCALPSIGNEAGFIDEELTSAKPEESTALKAKTTTKADTENPELMLNVAMPKAEAIDLEEPILPPDEQEKAESPVAPAPISSQTPETASETSADKSTEAESAIKPSTPEPEKTPSLVLLGKEVQPGITTRLSWSPAQSFEGIATPTPVLIAHGSKPGPVLCLTASIHGDELNGIEIVRRVLYNLEADKLAGTVIGVPIVNLQGFHRASRYLSDRRDLNRYFPGNPEGSSASRIAYSFFNQVIRHCDNLVDLHTGSFHRTNLPQLRADLSKPEVAELTHGFGATVVLHSEPALGTLRAAAVQAGIPTVTLEAGGPMQLQESAVSHGVKGIQTLLNKLGMNKKARFWGDPEPVYYQSIWVRADLGGILFSKVNLGERVRKGDLLGEVTNPITNIKNKLISPHNGRILGMAVNQVVQPGFAAYRVGVQQDEEEMVPEPEQESTLDATTPEKQPTATPGDEEEPDLATNEKDSKSIADLDAINEVSE